MGPDRGWKPRTSFEVRIPRLQYFLHKSVADRSDARRQIHLRPAAESAGGLGRESLGLPLYRPDTVELSELELGTGRPRDEGPDQIPRDAVRRLRRRRVRRRQLPRPRAELVQAGDGSRDG